MWQIEEHEGVPIVRMTSNPVNKQNPDFFRDLVETFDRLDQERPEHPVVLTGTGNVFSAGIDFEFSFQLFQSRDLAAIIDWFGQFRSSLLRVLQANRLTVAAVNGHAFAGGLILALCCDFRVAREGPFQCGINEIVVGVPMPSVYCELIRFRIGSPAAWQAIMTGQLYSQAEGHRLGFYDALLDERELLTHAVQIAKRIPADCTRAYTHSKKMLQAPLVERIRDLSEALDVGTARAITDERLGAAQRRSLQALRERKRQ